MRFPAAILGTQILDPLLEEQLQGRRLSDLSGNHCPEMVLSGLEAVDRLSGGLPRGRITEIVGPHSSGRTSVLFSSLAQVTDGEEVCALIDPSGTFDPASAVHIGVDLERLLWIRTPGPDVDRALKTTDLLLQGGGFGLIAVDFGEFAHAEIQRVPSSSWFRLQRAVENTPTILLFLGQDVCTRTCASLVLRFQLERIQWSARLLHGIHPHVAISRSRVQPGMTWKRAPEHFRILPEYLNAAGNDPASHNEGTPVP